MIDMTLYQLIMMDFGSYYNPFQMKQKGFDPMLVGDSMYDSMEFHERTFESYAQVHSLAISYHELVQMYTNHQQLNPWNQTVANCVKAKERLDFGIHSLFSSSFSI